ncbi:SOS response-associated peptidase [Plastoroseomonas arctica]|uniref:Abasic site processing protein n=1 Tax=Plastoroseomonas arctica TaxID=1509237 RepID=A0AAF1KPH8_9PROT|nr:SOS response-associated peptidase [Plastoroseomonas arctica]MBR0657569.1 SOS response-associated peptidase [Plastoroseomonas arctica]
MCGRYLLQRAPGALQRYFQAVNPTPNHPPSWNIAPTQVSLVVRRHPQSGERHLDALRWGLVPRWAKDITGAARLMNARSEGIAQKPSFREAFADRRCLVPMDGFYEWRKQGAGKQAYAAALRSGEPMAMAGLWEGWKQPDGTWLRTYTIITTTANAKLSLVHERMPVILPPETWEEWLSGAADEAVLRPYPAEGIAIWPVDNRVGRFAENDAALPAKIGAPDTPAELDDEPPNWE